MSLDTDDPTAGFHGGNPESTAAHQSIEPSKRTLRLEIYRLIRRAVIDGKTCDELEAATGWSHQTTSARVTELKSAGWIVDSGRRRPTRSGRSAAVLIAAEHTR